MRQCDEIAYNGYEDCVTWEFVFCVCCRCSQRPKDVTDIGRLTANIMLRSDSTIDNEVLGGVNRVDSLLNPFDIM